MNRKFFTIPHLFKILFLLGLAVVVHMAYVTSFYIVLGKNFVSTPEMNFEAYLNLIPIITIASLILADILSMPRFFRKKNIDVVSQSLTFSTVLTLVTLSAKDLTVQRAFPRSVILLSYIILIIYVFIWEMMCSIISHKLYEKGELVIIGASDHTIQLVTEKINPSLKSLDLNLSEPIKYQDRLAIRAAIRRQAEIFICPDVPEDAKSEIILLCAKQRTVAYVVPQFYEISLYRSRLINLNDLMVFLLDRMALSFEQRLIKRTFDIVFSILAIILTSPLMLFAVIGIKCTDKGPVFFKQERLTIDNKPFNIIKFRTMIVNAESATGAVISGKDDPRVTKFGRILRRTKIDELPQFFNVLAGDMSVVGPRSERPEFVSNFEKEIPGYSQRFAVKAGITGLAQVAGNYDTTPQDKLRYDLLYIKNYSILQDIKIIFSTVRAILSPHLYNQTFKDNLDVYIAVEAPKKEEEA
ncbi:MAG: sugar transferase [Clostridiales bacterium]|nr:sugar transferase [Clostridiales bacterium]